MNRQNMQDEAAHAIRVLKAKLQRSSRSEISEIVEDLERAYRRMANCFEVENPDRLYWTGKADALKDIMAALR